VVLDRRLISVREQARNALPALFGTLGAMAADAANVVFPTYQPVKRSWMGTILPVPRVADK
jgi:hypothetical protein